MLPVTGAVLSWTAVDEVVDDAVAAVDVDVEEALVATGAAVVVDAVVADALVFGAVVAETGLAVFSKHLQALET